MKTLRARIAGLGSALPEKILTNDDLSNMVDTSDDWIMTRTGIRERRVCSENEATSDLAVKAARQALEAVGVTNVMVVVGDGSLGWRPEAPYDAILVAAASPGVPEPLVGQLADGGRLIVPIHRGGVQELTRVTRRGREVDTEYLGEARFVPLLGRYGFTNDDQE